VENKIQMTVMLKFSLNFGLVGLVNKLPEADVQNSRRRYTVNIESQQLYINRETLRIFETISC